MKNDAVWIFVGIIIVVFLIGVFYYSFMKPQQGISINMNINSHNSTVYPYQLIQATINITNTGKTAFRAVPFGVIYNGTLQDIYNISLPAGSHTQINFSKEALAIGNYSLEIILDPEGGSGIISNTSITKNSIEFKVIAAQKPNPTQILNSNNSYENLVFQNGESYVVTSYLDKQYGLSIFRASTIPAINAFLNPILNLTYSYIKNIYSAEAIYKNNTVYSVWIQGPLTQNIFYQAGIGANLTTENKTTKQNNNVAYIQLDKNTTICSWYQEGWTKSLAIMGTENCLNFINESNYNNTFLLQNKNPIPLLENKTIIQNITFKSIAGDGYGRMLYMNKSFVFESVMPNLVGSSTCYGLINVENNVSYCSSYLFRKNNDTIGPVSLIDTKTYLGNYNLSVISLINSTLVLQQTIENIQMLKSINYSGTSVNFSSGIKNSCNFNSSFSCSNPNFELNNLTMQIQNTLNKTVLINKIACYNYGFPEFYLVNKTIGSQLTSNIITPCYDNGNVIKGVALGLNLNIIMNYTVSNKSYTALGTTNII
ncbi:MAG: hypothetical protein QXD23_00105 [Candidatus Micrarchaeaceae archaeon]